VSEADNVKESKRTVADADKWLLVLPDTCDTVAAVRFEVAVAVSATSMAVEMKVRWRTSEDFGGDVRAILFS
jgi:HJR/Mrr/RecB family endonuclease